MRKLIESTSELESDLDGTELHCSNNFDTVHPKMSGSVLKEKQSFRILGFSFASILNYL